MAGGGQGSGGMGGGQVAGGMGGMGGGMGLLPGERRPDRNPGGGMGGPVSGTMGGAGGDLGTASYMNKGGFDGGFGGGYGGGMGGFGGGYGMGSPFGGFGMGMPGMGYGGGMGGFGMGSPFGGFGGMPMYGGYGGGMGGYGGFGGMGGYGGGMGGFSRGMGSPFRGGMGGIQDRMYREQPGMAYEGGSPGFYSNPQTRSDTGFDFHPVDFEQHVMGGIQDRMYRGQPGGGMTQIQGGSSRGNLDPFNQALRGGFEGPITQGPAGLDQKYREPMIRPAVMPGNVAGNTYTTGIERRLNPSRFPVNIAGGAPSMSTPDQAPPQMMNRPAVMPQQPQDSNPKGSEVDSRLPANPQYPGLAAGVKPSDLKPGTYFTPDAPGPAPNPGNKPMGLEPLSPATSAQNAYDQALNQYNSPEYAAYYNSLAPSTRAYMHAPGNQQTGQYIANNARSNWEAYGGKDPFSKRTGGITSLLKRK